MTNSIIRRLKQTPCFLDIFTKIIDWQPIEELLNHNFKRNYNSVGSSAYPSLKMFKIILLQFLYNLSDRQAAESLFDRISFRKFAEFYYKFSMPSYSTICRFRNKLIKSGSDEELFEIINNHFESGGLIVKNGVVVNASIIKFSRSPRKTISEDNKPNILYSDDIDAKWTVKAETPYYDYKLHMSTDSKYGFIIGRRITSANNSDTKELSKIIQETKPQKGAFVLSDKGYFSKNNRTHLEALGFKDGIMHKANPGKKITKVQKIINSKISSIRGIVERTFGTLKENYSFHRAKYLGIIKTRGQFLLSRKQDVHLCNTLNSGIYL